MTTLVLQAAGSFVGTFLGGPLGGAIGRGLGALAGSAIDRHLIGEGDRVVEGPRLEGAQMLSSREGAVVPRAFGRVRLSGEVIWATRFEEVLSSEERGGKGTPTTTVNTYAYFANFALALCEGEIGGIGRIWADGRLIENASIVHRVHRGTEDQLPDSLIEAKQREIGSAAPAYRGTAYIVFEGFALEAYGNRIPQISVEVIRPIGALAKGVRAVSIIPGSSEFGYDPQPVVARAGGLGLERLNAHTTLAQSDWSASIDALQASCPNVERASLVVAWFGTDLRAGACAIEPRVEVETRTLVEGERWSVAGLGRAEAGLVSRIDGRAAYGGTPSDGAVRRAIADLAARGLAVTFNPFVLMDVPADNAMGQPAYPWRGRIETGPDVQGDCAAFEAAYRPMVLHYARLCAGTGVDLFVLGSELRGLTHARAADGTYPFVAALRRLAADVRAILGPDVRITYGADWSEYAAHRPREGDVFWPLDPLWADANVDLVGIDNYLPLTDWREAGANPDGARSALDPAALAAGIEGGEYFDWFYAGRGDRLAGRRTPITDGLGEPWVHRAKDIASWWASAHHARRGGERDARPSAWSPRSKPVAFLELGCPAIHAGANQPNVFLDAKSSESHVPHFSDGTRDDEMQAAFLEAHFGHWADSGMVDAALTHVWAWDARPWPAFPDRTDVWSDGVNWHRGHWLNGRAAKLRLRDLIAAVLTRAGVTAFDVSDVEGMATGYALGSAASPRAALEGLLDLYGIDAFERDGTLVFRSRGRDEPLVILDDDLVDAEGEPLVVATRAQEADLPQAAVLEHLDPASDFQPAAARSRRLTAGSRRDASLSLPVVLDAAAAQPLVESWLHRRWAGRETLRLGVARDRAGMASDIMPGRAVVLPDRTGTRIWRIVAVEEGDALEVTLVSTEPEVRSRDTHVEQRGGTLAPRPASLARAVILDLPLLAQPAGANGTRLAVAADPWPGPYDVSRVTSGAAMLPLGRVAGRATIGRLTAPLPAADPWRWDERNVLEVELVAGTLSSAPRLDVLNGANVAAVRTVSGWEVLQFRDAELVDRSRYRLRGLLRGQAGTEALAGAAAGADFVRIDASVAPLDLPDGDGPFDLLLTPAGGDASDLSSLRLKASPGRRDRLPFRPVHLRLDGTRLTWRRRDRGLADSWNLNEVPMSEERELYRVTHSRAGRVLRAVDVAAPSATLTDPAPGDTVAVAQVSAAVGPGPAASLFLNRTRKD